MADGIECPKCGCTESRVLRTWATDGQVRRQRECQNEECEYRFTTGESTALPEASELRQIMKRVDALKQQVRRAFP